MTAIREVWLLRAGKHTSGILTQATGLAVPEHYVSVGFPKGVRARANAMGQCWEGALSSDRRPHLFVSPVLSEAPQVLAVLLHEQIHAAVGPAAGHRGEFVKAARAVGFVRPWTAANCGPELRLRLNGPISELGSYPHAALTPGKGRRPGSRLRLWECACPVRVRVASDCFAATCDVCLGQFVKRGA